MLQVGYRQIAALLLGTAITLTSLGFVYNWHSYFIGYQNRMTEKYNQRQTARLSLDSAAERRIALTYCANQLLRQNAHVFDEVVTRTDTIDKTEWLVFYEGAQKINIEKLLSNDVERCAHYQLRRHRAGQYKLEVTYD